MKRILFLLLILCIIFSTTLTSCTETTKNESEKPPTISGKETPSTTPEIEIETKVVFTYTKYEPENEELIPCFSIEDSLSDNILRYAYTYEDTSTYGYMDIEFNVLCLPDSMEPAIFTNGLAIVYPQSGEKRIKVINIEMEDIDVDTRYPFKYKDNWYYRYVEEPREETRMNGRATYLARFSIDKYKEADFNKTLVRVYIKDLEHNRLLWGFKTFHDAYVDELPRDEGFIVEPIYTEVREFNEGLAAVKNEEKWGYLDENGDVAIDFIFDRATDFQNGVAFVGEINKEISVGSAYGYNYGLIDKNGQALTDIKYSNDNHFKFGFAVVREWDGRYNILNINGHEVFPETFEYLKMNDDGSVMVRNYEGYYYTDLAGNKLNGEIYQFAKPFSDGLAAVAIGRSWGYIGVDGLVKIEPQYETANNFLDGFAIVKKDKKSYIVDRDGNKYLGELNLTNISKFNEDGYALAYEENFDENQVSIKTYYILKMDKNN